MNGILKACSVLAVLLLAGLGILFVLDLVPREQLQTLAVKSLLTAAILAAAGLVLALLLRRDD